MHTVQNIYNPLMFLLTTTNIVFIILLTQYTLAAERAIAIFFNLFYHATDAPIYSNNVLAVVGYKPYLYVFYLVSFLLAIGGVVARYYTMKHPNIVTYLLKENLLPFMSHFALALSFVPVMVVSGIMTLDRLMIGMLSILLSSTLISPLLQRKLEDVEINMSNFRFILIGGMGFCYVYVVCLVNVATSPVEIVRNYAIIMLTLQMVLTGIYILSVIDVITKLVEKKDNLFLCVFQCRELHVLTHILVGCVFTFAITYLDKKKNTISLSYDYGLVDLIS